MGEKAITQSHKELQSKIKACINAVCSDYVALGYYLKQVNDQKLYIEDNYTGIGDYAAAEYGIAKDRCSWLIRIAEKFCVPGSPELLPEYRDFNISKLREMIYLTDEQLEQVTEDTTVKKIRDIRKAEKKPEVKPSTSQLEKEDKVQFFDDSKVEVTVYPEGSSLSTPGCNLSSCFMCARDCGKRQKQRNCRYAPLGNPFPCTTMEVLENIRLDGIAENCLFFHEGDRPWDRPWQPCCKQCEEKCGYACQKSMEAEAVPQTIAEEPEIIDAEYRDVPEPEYTDRPRLVKELLNHHKQRLKEIEKVYEVDKNGRANHIAGQNLFDKQKLEVEAFSLLLKAVESEQEKPEQPELPVMKNNDQRKEFLESFETWPVWIDNKETEERYYRYDLPDGNSIVIKIYFHSHEWRKEEQWGYREIYLLEPGKHFKNGETNMTSVIEHLKGMQKKKEASK